MPIILLGKENYQLQVDQCDLARVKKHKWHLHKDDTNVYACRRERCKRTGKRRKIYLHRWLLDIDDPQIFVDHVDGDGLNCRRKNLNPCSIEGNNKNITRGIKADAKRIGGGKRGV